MKKYDEAKNAIRELIEKELTDGIKFSRKDASQKYGVSVRTIRDWAHNVRTSYYSQKTVDRRSGADRRSSSPKSDGGTLTDFREKYDDSVIVPKLIEDGIEKHLRNENGDPKYMKDAAFREVCGVSIGKWRRYADDYKHLQVTKNQEIFWGHPEIIDEMRRIVSK